MGKSSPIIPKVAFISTVSLNLFSVGKHLILKYSLILQQSCKLRLTCAKTAKPGPGSAQPRPRPTPTPWCPAARGPLGGPEAPHVGYCQCSRAPLGPIRKRPTALSTVFPWEVPPTKRAHLFSCVWKIISSTQHSLTAIFREGRGCVASSPGGSGGPQTPWVRSSSPALPAQEAAEPRQPGQLPCRS